MKISASYWMFEGGLDAKRPIAEAMQEAKDVGFDAIELCIADEGVLTHNTTSDNYYGIYFNYNCNNNEIYQNNFINNQTHAIISSSTGNVFSHAMPIGGNYWSGWTTPNADGDALVDEPYVFTSGQDALPWVRQNAWANLPPTADAGADQISHPRETVTLDGSGSVFHVDEPDAAIEKRCAEMDIHPTGALFGVGNGGPGGTVAGIERESLSPHSEFTRGLESLKLDSSRRALRLLVGELGWQLEDDVLWLEFGLPKGGFATSVIREIAGFGE